MCIRDRYIAFSVTLSEELIAIAPINGYTATDNKIKPTPNSLRNINYLCGVTKYLVPVACFA